ncbi:MAG: glycosyltransferase family 39 protein [Bacteroidales bacterium]|nr:glycosyltransferase family 39 protein [Bacteroidales bacterium]
MTTANQHWLFKRAHIIIFGLYFIIGIFAFNDYGVPIDEFFQEKIGYVNAKYIVNLFTDADKVFPKSSTHPDLHDFYDKDYGPAFELLVIGLEQLFGFESHTPPAISLRHLMVFLVYFLSLICLYGLLLMRVDKLSALLALLFIMVTPRFVAHANFNSKDTVFFSMVVISFYFLVLFFKTFKYKHALLAGVAIGLTITLRIIGVVLVAFIPLFLYQVFMEKETNLGKFIKSSVFAKVLVLAAIIFVSMVAFFPFLWESPIRNFFTVIENMSKFRFYMDHIFYMGELHSIHEIPWHYIFVWIGISTPVVVLLLSFLGIGIAARRTNVKQLKKPSFKFVIDVCLAGLLFGIFALVLYKKPVLYNGWRHMFFLYLPIIYFTSIAISQLFEWLAGSKNENILKGFYVVLVLVIGYLAFWNVRNHPNQQVYFNVLAGKAECVEKNFIRDYWGVSYRQGLEYLLEEYPNDTIRVRTRHIMFDSKINPNIFAINEEDKDRIKFVSDINDADFYITEFYQPGENFEGDVEIKSLKAGRIKILSIYKMEN